MGNFLQKGGFYIETLESIVTARKSPITLLRTTTFPLEEVNLKEKGAVNCLLFWKLYMFQYAFPEYCIVWNVLAVAVPLSLTSTFDNCPAFTKVTPSHHMLVPAFTCTWMVLVDGTDVGELVCAVVGEVVGALVGRFVGALVGALGAVVGALVGVGVLMAAGAEEAEAH